MKDAEATDDGQKALAGADADDNSITLDPDVIEDLGEELTEIGFSAEVADWIVSKVPV
jgi:hypothetical protein